MLNREAFSADTTAREPLAIVGIGCRLPGGSDDPAGFWSMLAEGRSGIREVPSDRWNLDRFYHSNPDLPGRMITKWGGFVDRLQEFDASFWGISPREAVRMDPQQRWLLETAWEAIEDAGIAPSKLRGSRTGVYLGISSNDYAGLQMPYYEKMDVHTNSGCTLSIASNRVSYLLDLKGPSLSIDTACSSALVAVEAACDSIWSGTCDAALAGGVNAIITPHATVGFSKATMVSPDGRCFAFDSRANGYVRGEGAGMIFVRPLSKAIEAGDSIYAVIRAAVVNQDGHTTSMPIPSLEGQTEMLREAYRRAGVSPRQVVYVEAHGTGTPVGDPIETTALGNVIGAGRRREEACLLGSVKTNVGHLEPASGIAGLIKAALVLKRGQVPPNLNFEKPNPNIPFDRLRLKVSTELQPLPRRDDEPPIAAVNSFGFGGTNAHVVLQGAPEIADGQARERPASATIDRPYSLPISARSEESEKAYARAYADLLTSDSASIADICYSAGTRKEHHDRRLIVRGRDAQELRDRLNAWLESQEPLEGIVQGRASDASGVTFVFTGQGVQRWGMGRQLLEREPRFRETIEQIDEFFRPLAGWSLADEFRVEKQHSRIDRTDVAQPAIFALQVGLVELWKSWGVEPRGVVGHSVGEVAAAYCAGVYSLEDAVKVIYHRSRLQNTTGGAGGMFAAGISPAKAREAIAGCGGRVELAVINSPNLVTLAGDTEPLNEVFAALEAEGTFLRRLPIDYAFHSRQMDPIRDELLESLADIRPRNAKIPFYSTVTGGRLEGERLDGMYWWRNVRNTVLFAPAIASLAGSGADLFVEIGPHPALKSSMNEVLSQQGTSGTVLGSLKRDADDSDEMVANLSALHLKNVAIDWAAANQSQGRFVRLPRYPWNYDRHWLESEESSRQRLTADVHPLLGLKIDGPLPSWEFVLDGRVQTWLEDHRIWESLVLPAATYGEIGLALARELFPGEPYAVEKIVSKKAVFIPDDGFVRMRVVLDPRDRSFSVYTAKEGTDWELSAQARLVPNAETEPPTIDLAALEARLDEVIEHKAYYDEYIQAGYGFGPRFRHVQRVHFSGNEALGEMLVPADLLDELDRHWLHPAVLDSFFHCTKGVHPRIDGMAPEDNFFLPESIGRVRLYVERPPIRTFGHVILRSRTDDAIVTDIHVYDEAGRRVADVLAFRVERAEQKRKNSLEDGYFRFNWKPFEAEQTDDASVGANGHAEAASVAEILTSPASVSANGSGAHAAGHATPSTDGEATKTGSYLLIADERGIAESLAQKLTGYGHRAVLVRAGESFAESNEGGFSARIDDAGELGRILGRVAEAAPLTAVVHCASLDATPSDRLSTQSLKADQRHGVLSVLALAHAAVAASGQAPPRMMLVTSDVHEIVDGDDCSGVAASPIVGFARAANNEHPEYRWTTIDLDSTSDPESSADALLAELTADDAELETGWRSGKRYVHRLEPARPDDLPVRMTEAALPNGSVRPYRLETSRPGVLTNLSLRQTHRPDPAPDQIEVRVQAGGINFRDVMKALAIYPGAPIDRLWFGDDFSGIVERVGSNVREYSPGDQVAGMAPYCFRSYALVDRRMAFPKPGFLTHPAAATLPTVFLTAHYALVEVARMQPGEKVLIHAGTGGVGQAAIQVAKRLGLEIFATAGTPEKRRMLKEMGVAHAMDSRTLAFADEIMEITSGQGVDAVLNSLAGDFVPKSLSVLAPFGRFLEIGKVDVYNDTKIGLESLKNNVSYFVIDLAQYLEKKPETVARMFAELAERFAAEDYRPLSHTTFPVTEVVEAFRFMAQGKHVGKNVLSFDEPDVRIGPDSDPKRLYRSDATYLVTGGAGGFGLETALDLTRHGARHVALMSRSGPRDEESLARIEAMRAEGVQVLDLRADVTDESQVREAIERVSREMSPLAGVIHGAMTLDDDFLVALDESRFNKVLDPKMLGAWNLHQATLHLPLELFVCYSSFSGVTGAARQANYDAGNVFLDMLVRHRRKLGLPGLSVNWGALGEAGFVARNRKTAEYLDKVGLKPLTNDEALAALRRLVASDVAQTTAARVDWQSLGRLSPFVRSPIFSAMASADGAAEGGAIRGRALAAAPENRESLIEQFLAEEVAGVFGLEPAKLDRTAPLTGMGLDSLMAVELINRVETALGMSVPMASVLGGPSVAQLAKTLAPLLVASAGGASGSAEGASAGGSSVPSLERTPNEAEEFPLSEGQQALWFLYRLAPESSAYNLTFSARFTPHVDVEAMQEAFASLFDRHPMLDVVFSDASGVPMQRFRNSDTIDFVEHDASDLSEEQLHAALVEAANRPFDLERGPIVRLELFRSEDSHVALLGMHHIMSDAWSVTVLIRDLIEAYFAVRAGRIPQYRPQPYSFQDFVAWESKHLAGESGEKARDFWVRNLQGAPLQIDLPTDHPRPTVQTFRGGTKGFQLDEELTQEIVQFAAERNVTLFTLLLSAYETTLHGLSGQDDFLVGVPLAGRQQRELHDMIGYFVNPVPMRSRVDDDPSFLDFVSRNSSQLAEALDRQRYPLKRLVQDLDAPRDVARSPLFQVAFSMERIPGFDSEGIAVFLVGQGGHRFRLGDLTVETIGLSLRQAQFDVMLVVEEAGGSVYGCWQYNRDLFDAETIDRFADAFELTLRRALRQPTLPVSKLGGSSEATAEEVDPYEWLAVQNRTATVPAETLSLQERIELQAAQSPDATAVVCGEASLSYGELNRRANQVAHRLRAEGVRPDDRVGICMRRGVDLVVGLLGILKSGGAYVPLDPSYPRKRLAGIVEDAGIALALVQDEVRDTLESSVALTIAIDDNREWDGVSIDDPTPTADGRNLMYVIFTSGSTGRPKGAGVYRDGFQNLVDWYVREFGISGSDRTLVVTSHGFDLTQKNFFAPLTVGGQVHLTACETFDPVEVTREIERGDVTLLNCTPSVFYPLVEGEREAWPLLDSLRTVFLGGEPIDMSRLAEWRSQPNFAAEVVNTYGPTECTDICSFYRVSPTSTETSIPVGFPIDNVRTYILDERQEPIPVGATGELCVGGAGVGGGYVNDAQMTDARFLPDPFAGSEEAKLYRTGDLCRYRQDGAIEFIGRSDDQVKLRGFRIELGEIETALREEPGVRDAVAMIREDSPGIRRLVAYLVTSEGDVADIAALSASLADRLPSHMIPSAFVTLDALPLSPHGKLDRRALPSPEAASGPTSDAYEAPRDEAETKLVELWQEILGLPQVGVRDGFFELGGDSLSSVALASRIRREFGVDLPLAQLLQANTVERMAILLRQAGEQAWSPLVTLQPGRSGAPLFLVHPLGGNVLCYLDLVAALDQDSAIYGIQSRGVDGTTQPVESLETMVEEYVEALREVQPDGPYRLAAWSAGGTIAYAMASRLREQGEEVSLALLDSIAPDRLEIDADDESAVLSELTSFFDQYYGLDLKTSYSDLAPLASTDRRRFVMDRLKTAGSFPPGIDEQYVERFLDVCQANLQAIRRSRLTASDFPVLLVRASERGRDEARRPQFQGDDLGWRNVVGKQLSVVAVPGNHVSMLLGENASTTAAAMRRIFGDSTQSASGKSVSLIGGSD
ncbi:MAG TPA: amino acid adenylation domain-containing protein [Pirellulaceae bacterium]|jgi:amino acid adenylation domain-containing protein|nr:amino acid adenylation domain-containing protein [Pirellulaceae bacterium]